MKDSDVDPQQSHDYTYTFSVNFVQQAQSGQMETVYSGTLVVNVPTPGELSGTLTLPNYTSDPFPMTAGDGEEDPPSLSGSNATAQIDLWFDYAEDGFLAEVTYLGGVAEVLDYSGQETFAYQVQGVGPLPTGR